MHRERSLQLVTILVTMALTAGCIGGVNKGSEATGGLDTSHETPGMGNGGAAGGGESVVTDEAVYVFAANEVLAFSGDKSRVELDEVGGGVWVNLTVQGEVTPQDVTEATIRLHNPGGEVSEARGEYPLSVSVHVTTPGVVTYEVASIAGTHQITATLVTSW